MEIFKTTRIRFNELYQDSLEFIKGSYGKLGQHFTLASPMGQLLQVMLGYGRMILFYIEDSITELNIKTATRSQSIRGLAALTGHNPSRAIGARGTITLNYNGKKINQEERVVTIPNYTKIRNINNNLTYTLILPGEETQFDLTSSNSSLDVNIIQGSLEFQQVTGTGTPLQSFNIQNKKGSTIDNFYVSVYVNGRRWEIVNSILDMSYNQEGVMVKTGQTGGIDLFFGNGYNGSIPPMGSTILIEYLITDGQLGNIDGMNTSGLKNWEFETPGFALNGNEVNLNNYISISIKNKIMFGSPEEPLYLTRLLAPNMSRSFVLANKNNYIYFLRKLGMFNVIDAIPGFSTFEDQYVITKYNQSKSLYDMLNVEYRNIAANYGLQSTQALAKKEELDNAYDQFWYYSEKLEAQKKDDNTVYLFLIPDITKRIPVNENYFTCSETAFILSENEKLAILDLIEQSGQRILTVDNAILDLQFPRFSLNMSLILWEGISYDMVRQNIITQVSNYFMKNTRRDRIPVSDIIKIIEEIEGVDSVNIWFDADKNNINLYKEHYGIDDYGDILLERNVKDAFGNNVPIRDLYPLIRGGFENAQGTYYEDSIAKSKLSSLNIQVRGYSPKDLSANSNIAILNNL